MYRLCFFFFHAEDGIRDAQESRGLGDLYKRQVEDRPDVDELPVHVAVRIGEHQVGQLLELSLIHL